MKTTRKLLLISFLCIPLTTLLLIPMAPAQDIIYDGADTENCPSFSVYPSEVYEFNVTDENPSFQRFPESYDKIIIQKANVSDLNVNTIPPLIYGNGVNVWSTIYEINATSGTIDWSHTNWLSAYWNESLGFCGTLNLASSVAPFIPLDSGTGTVSVSILNAVIDWINYSQVKFEHRKIYPAIHSFHIWNESVTHFIKANYTEDGILLKSENNFEFDWAFNYSLMSQPAQLPPVFSFATTSGLSTVPSRHISLDLTIPAADNNNDGLPDTDYQYSVFESGVWSDWGIVTPFIDYDLGSVPAGNYTLTVEVKNMYGITQEQIEVEYIPSSSDAIPGYSALIILVILGFSVSILLGKYRKKL
ncbi:MAG: hypothetical protein KGD58_01540 [Candidatus Lokiarchaeota archaeon]|nr:hypothetical protein [Candidatus Lokiarchaeota archaeon]